jgi:hypothetical protein
MSADAIFRRQVNLQLALRLSIAFFLGHWTSLSFLFFPAHGVLDSAEEFRGGRRLEQSAESSLGLNFGGLGFLFRHAILLDIRSPSCALGQNSRAECYSLGTVVEAVCRAVAIDGRNASNLKS